MNRIISILFSILLMSTSVMAQQSAMTFDQETTSTQQNASSSGASPDGLLDPNQVWNDPSSRYRLLDPWRIALEFGGGVYVFNDMSGDVRTGITSTEVPGGRAEDSTGVFIMKIELGALVSRSQSNDWYFVSQMNYEGRSVDNPIEIRSGTHQNEADQVTLLNVLPKTEILNRNQINALTGVRVISRRGQLAYRGGLLTGIGSRKWYEEDLVWVTQIELELAYRFSDALFGPFGTVMGRAALDSEEVAGIEGISELGIRYVSDSMQSIIAQIDGFMFVEGGKWNDDTSTSQVVETRGAVGIGGRLRVWNFTLGMRFGYILDYGFEENRTSGGPFGLRRRADGSGDFLFMASLLIEF